MKTRFSLFGFIAILLLGIGMYFASCNNNDTNGVVTYKGHVVYLKTTTPFPDLEVKVTNGDKIHVLTHTDASGDFSLKVKVSEIDGSYYVLVGDSTCVTKKVDLSGYGQAEVDLGTIEVEGPSAPIVETKPVLSVSADAAVCSGEVTSDGRLTITARGVCYSKKAYPTITDDCTKDGTGLGEFTSNLSNLEHNTIYYVRAYATNRMGVSYGEQVKFTTEEGVPIVVTDSVIRITAHSARCKGHVESDGGFAVSKRGTCWSKRPDPTIDDDCTDDGSGLGEFTSAMNNLIENTQYYVRTYATNSTGTVYGEQVIITTLDGLAVVTTDSITSVTATGCTAYGTVVSDCDIPVTTRGFCYATTQYPTIENDHTTVGKGLGKFQSNITNLGIGTTYYIRAYATNATETVYGAQLEIRTKDGMASVTTKQASSNATTISIAGEVTDNGGFAVTDRGVCYSSSNSEPTITDEKVLGGQGNGTFNVSITGLSAATTYHLRAYATNANGTAYGASTSVTTSNGQASVTTGTITSITALTASGKVTVTNAGGATLQTCGICWSTSPNPSITNNTAIGGNQINTAYTCNMTELTPNTTYYVRGYATTNITTSYGSQVTFTTASGLPVLTTTEPTATSTTINAGGNITSDGGYSITSRGICYSTTNSTPTIADQVTTSGIGTGSFTSTITNVSVSTTYYVRAYATNSIGTGYGNILTVITGDGLPQVTTTIIGENVTQSTAISGGQVISDGGYAITARGVCWSTSPLPTISDNVTTDGSGTGYYSSTVTGIDLTSSCTYYVRAYATNANGTVYGQQVVVSKENLDYKNLPTIQYGGYVYKIYPDIGVMTWDAADAACESLVYSGYDDWFLPNKDELTYIMTTYRNGWYNDDGTPFNFIPRSYSVKPASAIKRGANYWTSTQTSSTSHYYVYFAVDSYYGRGMGTKYYDWYYHPETPTCAYQGNSNSNRVRPVRKYLTNQQ